MGILFYLGTGAVILITTAAFYILTLGVPMDHETWINFSQYFGSVAGPLLSFLALIAVAQSLRLQNTSIEHNHERQLESQHLRALDERFRDINNLLDRPFIREGEQALSLRLILEDGPNSDHVTMPAFAPRLEEFLSLVAFYCEMVALYRENISPYFDTPMYQDRGARLLDAIKPFHKYLEPMAKAVIEFSDMHLKGEKNRKPPKAMRRSSRD